MHPILKSITFVGIINLFLGGCVVANTDNDSDLQLKAKQQELRVSIGNAVIGQSHASAVDNATAHFAVKADCSAIKVAGFNKRSSLEEHCTFLPGAGQLLFGLPLSKVEYFFKDTTLRKIDVEFADVSGAGLDQLTDNISKEFNTQATLKGSLRSWTIDQDAIVALQQGVIKLRVVSLSMLEKNSVGPSIQDR